MLCGFRQSNYEEGNPRKFIVPDVFVVKDCDPRQRWIFKVWEEGRVPNTIFEVTSRSTRREDEVFKPKTFALLEVPEYFLYDPTAEYLKPPLRGFRLEAGEYCAIEPDSTGALISEQLGLALRLEARDLALFDQASGARLITEGEAGRAALEAAEREREARLVAEAAREAERRALQAERRALEAERQAREAAEAELQRLRERLGDSTADE